MKLQEEESTLLELIDNVQIRVEVAHRTQCAQDWRDMDFVPEFNRFYFILEGEGRLEVDGRESFPRPGQLCLMPAFVRQSYSALQDRQPFHKYWCHFTASVGAFDLFQWINAPLCIDIPDPDRMKQLFAELTELHIRRTLVSVLREKAIMLEIISTFLEQMPVQVLKHRSEDMQRIRFIQDYVEAHLQESLSVNDMAAALHLHPNYFISYFKKQFGMPPAKYVNRKRMDKARLLLASTSLSIKEIAERAGFPDTQHFAKSFRKETGLSPTEYRAAYA
ncbi:AraC family transcriptional regulator [Paenibacillus pasadenensis]|uniref:AraC family transcriptional regulator n=1 Tax=Paenibacillus pasadenensis TaxID=217090 RepID=UPI00203CC377|nr:AraC family transcriptional regulator [Paenibacillus pasadenensis]MCM3748813.1 AraC family transcriptional regulator [Paenibacillus pasadenensis]